ncbi:hypothetical protein P175DRAFT_0525698 [Aspergillus ochraceoroseus IBT 24754]|uniref:Enoyl reductase (ER) domain-containing protein n=3 Tax=Aspergillus subgen. Nidulantes TaxID=2720870 RepID=A0A0F8X449_9EURO|nr:uncharacterized protein P175DRAFT_0525698 [Aspergillus ochraceoroseus IBT 24754]KKK24445.1 hypothetical protein ARAM_006067 [Aspergillus rambellii]KKK25103.1 hypothetical protein AOCH_003279 [Aspergillus ochraceoroseus]PTU18961.1 hypothetical protein P175DRAFT_0525698 [Aspergillus ochraceoroseus IBT 24754]
METHKLQHYQTVIVARNNQYTINEHAPIPEVEPDAVLIRSEAVAINPVDANSIRNFAFDGTAAGFDVAGTVVAVGKEVDCGLQTGDRVGATVHGMNPVRPADGAFAQYVVAAADLTMKIPADLPIESAASLPLGVGTAGLALRSLTLDKNVSDGVGGHPVLVNGGSTATGTLAIQLLRHAGHRPIATCSPSNFDLVRKGGAEAVFDYRSPSCAIDIRAYTRNGLRYVMDCISETASMELCYAAIGRAGGRYTALHPYSSRIAATRPTVKADWVFQPALFGRDVNWPSPFGRPADPALRAFAKHFYQEAQKLLEQGQLRPHPVSVSSDGFPGIIAAVGQMQEKRVSGAKLVCRIP